MKRSTMILIASLATVLVVGLPVSYRLGAARPMDSTFIVKGSLVRVASFTLGDATAQCPTGDVATGGGDATAVTTVPPPFFPSLAVSDSFPTPRGLATGGTPTGWEVIAFNPTNVTLNLVAYVVCKGTAL